MDTVRITQGKKDKLKDILLLNRSFWPDIEATGQFLTQLCEQLTSKYKITVIAGRSYYGAKESFKPGRLYCREEFNGIRIIRVRHTRFWKGNLAGRIINWITYSILSLAVSLRIKTDLIIVCTDPPFLGIMAMLVCRLRNVPFLYNCRDLFPDVAYAIGKLRPNFVSRAYDYLNKRALCAARLVIPLGQSMEDRIIAKGVSREHIKVIPDWVDISEIKPIPKKENHLIKKFGLEGKFVVMYSGNLGLSQEFGSILRALTFIKNNDSFCLVFIGEGAGKKNLEEEVLTFGLKNVLFFPHQPYNQVSFFFSLADLHLVPLKKGLSGLIVPSKIYGIMAAGRPFLAITDAGSEPARLIKEFNCGLWSAPGDVDAIVYNFGWAFQHPDELEKMGQRARQLAEARFDKNKVIKEWVDLLTSL